jgi:hypothetical protein
VCVCVCVYIYIYIDTFLMTENSGFYFGVRYCRCFSIYIAGSMQLEL